MNRPRLFLALTALFLSLGLAGCGLRPVYGDGASSPAAAALNTVDISNIPDRSGQKLRNELIDRFYQDGRPADARYQLAVSGPKEIVFGIGIAKDATSTRSQMRISTQIALTDNFNPRAGVLLHRTMTATVSYNTLGSQYTTLVTEEDARGQALRDLADQIVTQLELYFTRGQ